MATKVAAPVTFYPKIGAEVKGELRTHLQLIYQKINNHAQAFAHLSALAAGTTNNTTVENIVQGGGGGSPIIGLGGINNQTGNTSYMTTVADNGVLLVLDDASPVAVTLTTGISSPWMIFATNLGSGLTIFTPTTGLINGGATFLLPLDYTSIIVFDGTNFLATALPVVPQNAPAVTHEWINSYNSATGAFTQTQPAFTDISGTLSPAQLPATGISVVYTTGPLTVGGTTGSLTFVDGILTAQVPAT